MKSYQDIKDLMLKGNPKMLRSELIHILYKLYLSAIQNTVSGMVRGRDDPGRDRDAFDDGPTHNTTHPSQPIMSSDKQADFLRLSADFIAEDSPMYARELAYLEQFILGLMKMPPDCARYAVEKDKKYKAIMSSNYTLVVSQFTFEMLESFEKLKSGDPDANHSTLTLINTVKSRIKVADDLTLEAYVGSAYLSTKMPIAETQKINAQPYHIGLLKDDLTYYSKLEELSKKKLNKDDAPTNSGPSNFSQLFPPVLAGSNPGLAIPALEVNPLGKRDQPSSSSASGQAQNEIKKVHMDKPIASYMSGIPETTLSSKIEFAKDYLDRKIIDKNSEPDIIKISLKDMPATVTIVEASPNAKVVLVGMSNGQVSGYFFSEEERSKYELEPKPAVPKSNLRNILETEADDVVNTLTACNFIGHSGAITCISINYDSKYFITGSTDGTARLWNLKVGECLAMFKGHTKPIWTVSLCPKGYYFATGGADSLIYLWITSKANPVMCFNQHEEDVTHLEFTESLKYLVSSSQDRSLKIWNLDDASLVRVIFFPEVIRRFKLTMNADIVVCGGEEGTIFVWDLVKAVKLHQFSFAKDSNPIMSIKLSIDERFFVISSKTRCLYFMTNALMQPKSKSAYDYLLTRHTVAERKLTGWEELSLNGIDITHKERIMVAQTTSLNQIYLVVVELPN